MYIAFGAIFFTTVTAYGGPVGIMKLIGGISFSLGLVLIVFGGAELFTGNNLMVISLLNKKTGFKKLLKNWFFVYIGNFIGSLIMVLLVLLSQQYLGGEMEIGIHTLSIANAKVNLDPGVALIRGILCNTLVCLAVWFTMVAKTIPGKVLGIIFPISGFVAMGYEHSVANMFFIPMGIMINFFAPERFWNDTHLIKENFSHLKVNEFLFSNLLPVTIGNIIGGVVFVGVFYWLILKPKMK